MAELEVWDETKENVMPIKSGRRMKKGLAPTASAVEEERRRFERDVIQNSTADDPLDTWVKYVATRCPLAC